MPLVHIDASEVCDWNTFHDVFARNFGFPSFYGRNMDAWIDCMSYLDDPSSGMTSIHGSASDIVVLQIDSVDSLAREFFDALVDCAAFVNWRRIERGDSAIVALSFHRSNTE